MNEKAKTVYNDLKKMILFDELESGEHLAEIKLAEQYGVSRLHIKSALNELASEKLIEHLPGRGYFVIGLTNEAIKEISTLRKYLTAAIVEDLIDRITEKELDELKKALSKIKVFISNEMFDFAIDEVINFYSLLQSYSDYSRVVGILEKYNDYIFTIISHSVHRKADHDKGYHYLASLVQCLEHHDLDACLKVVSLQDDYIAF